MSSSNRAAILTKSHKVLKKHYTPVAPSTDRSILEHLLYASCLENARHEQADEAFAKLQECYFDWNEVRVTTVAELGEVLAPLPDAAGAAQRLKKTLQSVFETHYSFELEGLRKQNLGKAVKDLEQYEGITPFAVAYVTQNGLGGHAIPTSQGVLDVLLALNVIGESEHKQQRVPGMERAIPKSKGVEYASLLHQLGADYHASPFSTRVRGVIAEIDPDAKQRLPKRSTKKEGEAEAAEPAAETNESPKQAEKPASGKAADKAAVEKKATASKGAKKKPAATSKKSTAKKTSKPAAAEAKKTAKGLAKKKPR